MNLSERIQELLIDVVNIQINNGFRDEELRRTANLLERALVHSRKIGTYVQKTKRNLFEIRQSSICCDNYPDCLHEVMK